MEDLKKLILDMRSEFAQRFTSIDSNVAQLEDKITTKITTHINTKLGEINEEIGCMKLKMEEQEKRIYILEKNSVQRNVMFFGVEEKECERSYSDLQENILEIIKNKIKEEIQVFEVQSVRRIGKKGSRPRPISVAFTTLGKKINILKKKKNLEGSNIYITEEFPVNILRKREELKEQQRQEKEKGNIAFIKYDKLIIKQNDKETNTNKRQLSVTPPQMPLLQPQTPECTTIPLQQRTSTQINKKYKCNKNTMMSYVKRTEDA